MTPRAPLFALAFAALAAPRGEALANAPRGAAAAAAGARYLVRVGEFVAHAAAPARSLAATAREALVRNLAREARVVLTDTDGAPAGGRRAGLAGYTIDGHVRVVEGAGATRVEVSLLVQTMPGREYRFESAVTLTLSGAGGGEALEEATRRAVGSAATRCLGELARQ